MADATDVSKDALLTVVPKNDKGQPTLGGIALTKKLGQGGMGAVYKGSHPRLGVEVAVKVLPFHLVGANPQAVGYFEREAKVAAKLNHPNLVRIFDVNSEKDPGTGTQVYYLIMEFVAGPTAGGLLRKRQKDQLGPMPEGDALDIVIGSTSGLAAAHEENIIHRDIKPDNIIIPINEKGEPLYKKSKLMDLGLAKSVDESASMGLTAQNVAMGTPGYMAPEQAEDAKTAGPPADVFSMGATLYALLSGSAPFAGTTIMQILRKTQGEPHEPLRFLNPKVTEATAALVDRCLDKDPGRRFPDAHALADALKICRDAIRTNAPIEKTLVSISQLAGTGSEPTAKTVPATRAGTKPPPPPEPPVKKSPIALILGLVAVLLIGAGVGIWYVFLREKPPVVDPAYTEFLKKGAEAETKSEWAAAIDAYEKAIAAKPDGEEAKKGLDRAKEQRSKAEQYASALKAANDALASQNWPEAERLFKALQAIKDTDEARNGIAKAQDEMKKISGAFGDALKRASEAMGKRDWATAEKEYDAALKIDSSSKAARDGKDAAATGRAVEKQARDKIEAAKKASAPDDAWDLYRAAVDVDPAFLDARFAAAEFALKEKRAEWYDEAIKDCGEAEKRGSPNEKAKAVALASDLKREKEKDARIGGALEKIVKAIDREDWEAAAKAIADARAQHPRIKLERFEQQVEAGRKWQAEFDAGSAAEKRNDLAGAIAAYARAEKLQSRPKSKEALKRLESEREKAFAAAIGRAKSAGDKGDLAGFDKAINEAKDLGSGRSEIADVERQYAHLALTKAADDALRARDYTTALAKADEALRIKAGYAPATSIRSSARYHLAIEAARKAASSGNREEAEKHLADARAINPTGSEIADIEKQLGPAGPRETHASVEGPARELILSRDGSLVVAAGPGYEGVSIYTSKLEAVSASVRGSGKRVFNIFTLGGKTAWGLYGDPSSTDDTFEISTIDLVNGKRTQLATTVSGMTIPVRAYALGPAPDGDNLVRVLKSSGSGSSDLFKIDIIGTRNGQMVKDLDSFQNQAHRFVRSSPDRSQFVTGGGTYQTYSGGRASAPIADTNIYFFSWPGLGQKVVRLGDDFGEITAFEFSPNGKKLIVGSTSGKLAMVDTNTYKIVHRAEVAGSVGSLSASDEKMGAAVIGGRVYIAEDGKATEQAGLPKAVSVALAADGKSMYVGGDDGKIRRYQLK